jgi:hypothetical protein
MNTILKIVTGFFLFCCVFLFCEWKCQERTTKKIQGQFDAFIDSVSNAKPVIDTVYRLRVENDTVTIYKRESRILVDTVECPERIYTGTYNNDMLSIRWRAIVFGQLQSIEVLPSSSYKFPEITIQRTVIVPERSPVQVNNRVRNSLWMGADVIFQKGLSGGGVGVTFIAKKGWGVTVGAIYGDNKLFWKAGMMLKLK